MTDDFALSEKDFQEQKRKKVAKPLLWFGMVSIVMFFAGLTSAVIVSKGDGNWFVFEIPQYFLISCFVIIFTSIFFVGSVQFAKKNNQKMVLLMLSLAIISGLLFVLFQSLGAKDLYEQGIVFTGGTHHTSSSYFLLISFMHILHLVGGLVALIITFFNAKRERYNSKNLLGLQVCSTYWHFLGAMWVYLYLFFNTII